MDDPQPLPPGSEIVFRVPRERFDLDITEQPTAEDLLISAGVPPERVEGWEVAGESFAGLGGANPELKRLLPPPPPGADHLVVTARLVPACAPADVPPEAWQTLDGVWQAILGLESGIDSLRLSVDALRAEMESAHRRPLVMEEKVHALQADVAQWNQAKGRVHHALPKARDFVHRATWAATAAERKRLGELYETHIAPRVPFPGMDGERERLEHLQKDRQVLLSQGTTVANECRAVLAEVQRALDALRRNAADRARKARGNRR